MTARNAHYIEERRRQLAEDRFGGICACGDHAWTRLTRCYVGLVDVVDADIIKAQAFSAKPRPGPGSCHAQRNVNNEEEGKRSIPLQHAVHGDPPEGKEAYFRNGNPLDCRRSNFVWGDRAKNGHRRSHPKRPTASRYKGVSRASHNVPAWCANISHDGKQIYLGSFPLTAEGELAAARTYDDAARKLYGEFAAVNFPLRSVAA